MSNHLPTPLLKYFNRQADSFLHHHKNLSGQPTEKDIHRVRLDIKKIRAVLKLVKASDPPAAFDYEAQLSLFLPLFEAAGQVRTPQVSSSIVRRYEFSPAVEKYIEYLEQKEKKAALALAGATLQFDLAQFETSRAVMEQVIHALRGERIIKAAKKTLERRIRKVAKMRAHSHGASHKIRKQLKEMLFITKILYHFTKDKKLKKLEANIKRAEQMIGHWHNTQVLLQSITRFEEKTGSIVIAGLKLLLEKDTAAALGKIGRRLKRLEWD